LLYSSLKNFENLIDKNIIKEKRTIKIGHQRGIDPATSQQLLIWASARHVQIRDATSNPKPDPTFFSTRDTLVQMMHRLTMSYIFSYKIDLRPWPSKFEC